MICRSSPVVAPKVCFGAAATSPSPPFILRRHLQQLQKDGLMLLDVALAQPDAAMEPEQGEPFGTTKILAYNGPTQKTI